jgi:2-keto-3-deoxy-L-fuconate dehydrogenase
MDRLKGKRALVTAAGQGIGRAIAEAFAAEGAWVLATDIDAEALQGLDGCEVRRLDVTDAKAISDLAARLGALDVIANVAGYVHAGDILQCSEADWAFAMELNATSAFRIIRAFLPAMLEAGGGSIVNVSSIAGAIKGIPNRFAYSASKAAMAGLTRSVAADYVTRGIRCNAICPGTVQSPSLDQRLAATGDYEAAHAAFVARQPMGRLGRPEEVAALAVYLASDEAGFTTGAMHIIDGGWIN